MRGKLVLTFLAGLIVGVVVAFTGWHPQALAQRAEKPPQWEYKAVVMPFGSDEATKKLNELADDGWEYVGLVGTSVPYSPNHVAHDSSVAFRRPKK
jgi:hypothetical protein